MTAKARPKTANERLKSRFEETLAASLIAAALLHLLVFQLTPTFQVADWSEGADQPIRIQPIDDIPLPAPPKPLPRPVVPIVGGDIDATATVDFPTWDEVATAPPAPPPVEQRTPMASSGFVVVSVMPVLLDPEGFQRELMRVYPPSLRNAGIGGIVTLMVQVAVDGSVSSASVGTTSGYPLLDEAALRLAPRMSFRPAMNRDQPVSVLVSIPVEFRVRR